MNTPVWRGLAQTGVFIFIKICVISQIRLNKPGYQDTARAKKMPRLVYERLFSAFFCASYMKAWRLALLLIRTFDHYRFLPLDFKPIFFCARFTTVSHSAVSCFGQSSAAKRSFSCSVGVLQLRTEFSSVNSQAADPTMSNKRLTEVFSLCRMLSAAPDRLRLYTPMSGSSVPLCSATVIGLLPARCAVSSVFISPVENSGASTLMTKTAPLCAALRPA